MVNWLISDLKNDNFGDLRFKKLAFRQRIYEKIGEFGDFWWYLGGLKWFEVKKWSLSFKKLDLGHVKEKMLAQIELSGKMGLGDQELSRSTDIQNFEVIVKSIEVSFRQLKLRKGLEWLEMTF